LPRKFHQLLQFGQCPAAVDNFSGQRDAPAATRAAAALMVTMFRRAPLSRPPNIFRVISAFASGAPPASSSGRAVSPKKRSG